MSWWDVVTVTVGAFVGAGAAFASNLLVRLIESRRREASALNELITEIHFRRVLRRVAPRLSPNPRALDPVCGARSGEPGERSGPARRPCPCSTR
jgi:hypothetical protein